MCVALAQRNDYLTGRLPQQQADSSLSAQHSDDKDGESDEDAETTFDMSTVDIEAQFKELKALERKQQAERKRKLLSLSADSPKGKDDMGGSSSGAARGASGGAATQRAIANRGSNKKPRQESDGASGSERKGSAGRDGGAVLSEGECIVCWEEKACVAPSPCGHVCLCETCAPQQRQCPVCRSDVSCTLRVYFSMACLQ